MMQCHARGLWATLRAAPVCSVSLPHRRHVSTAAPRVLLFGSDEISVPTLERLAATIPRDRLHVVCPTTRAAGRGRAQRPLPLYSRALDLQLHVVPVPPTANFRLTNFALPPSLPRCDIGVVVSFGYFLPPAIIQSFSTGCVNVHPSLLPQYRGASPIQHALWRGDSVSGVSLIEVHPTIIDGGSILIQRRETIAPADTFATLSQRLAAIGAECVLAAVQDFDGLRAQAVSQPTEDSSATASRAPKLGADFGFLDFTEPARSVFNRWRASFGFVKPRTSFHGQNMIVTEMSLVDDQTDTEALALGREPGSLAYDSRVRQLVVRCGDGGRVAIGAVHLANKPRAVDAHTFYYGQLRPLAESVILAKCQA